MPSSVRLGVDGRARRAMLGSREILLTATEFEVLWELVLADGGVVTYGELVSALSTADATQGAVEVQISRLRRKLGESGGRPHFIRTVRGVGYRLVQATAEGSERPVAVALLTDTGRVLEWVSTSVEGVLGWTAAELTGTTLTALVHPDDQARLAGAWSPLAQGRSVRLGLRVRRSDGAFVDVLVAMQPILGPDGALAGIVAEWHRGADGDVEPTGSPAVMLRDPR